MKTVTKVSKGMKFRSPYADANPLWEVRRSLGGSWACVILNEPVTIKGKTYDSDWVGVEKAFLVREILAAVNMMKMFEEAVSDNDRWYTSLPLGTIVHYADGFSRFVRCEVVFGNTKDEPAVKRNVLKPIALVGDWRPTDLPRRYPNGNICLGYHAENITNGKTFLPNYANVYESPVFSKKKEVDPATLTPVDLALPPMTRGESDAAKLWQLIEEVQTALKLSKEEHSEYWQKLTDPAVPEMLLKRAVRKLEPIMGE